MVIVCALTSVSSNHYRYKEETDQSYFEGTGYASVTLKELNTHSRVRYEQTIETTADEGIVFFAADGVNLWNASVWFWVQEHFLKLHLRTC